ncbi:type IV secretion system DNA-binding domain-containing protein [Sulfurimonas sp.]
MFEVEAYEDDDKLRELENEIYRQFISSSGLFYDENSLPKVTRPTISDMINIVSGNSNEPETYIFNRNEEHRKNSYNKTWIGTCMLAYLLEDALKYNNQNSLHLIDSILMKIREHAKRVNYNRKNNTSTQLKDSIYPYDENLLTYQEYLKADKNDYSYNSYMYNKVNLYSNKNLEDYGTLNYTLSVILKELIAQKLDVSINNNDRERHTYITGQSGSGKSELLKHLIFSTYKEEKENFILIDPHGDLADDIFKIHVNESMLSKSDGVTNGFLSALASGIGMDTILVDPFLDSDNVPIINPMEFSGTETELYSYTEELISVFKEILGQEFSLNAETLLAPCIATLLQIENSSLYDLQLFMDDENNFSLVKLGMESKNIAHRNFFTNGFYKSNLSSTKNALFAKLQNLLNNPTFSNMTTGKSTIDIEKTMNGRGNIIFKLSKQKMKQTLEPIGRFIVAKVQSIALKRADKDEDERAKTHLYIDEFQNFITPSIEEILTESRKYKLYVTLAHQVISQLETIKLRDIILSNTNIKFVGQNGYKTLQALSNEVSCSIDMIENLNVGQFYLRIGKDKPIKIKSVPVPEGFISADNDEIKRELNRQKSIYYSEKSASNYNSCFSETIDKTSDETVSITENSNELKTPKFDSF